MKKLLTLSAVALLTIGGTTQSTTADQTILLSRHAEKQDDGTRNPSLTEAGKKRAKELACFLKTSNFGYVYSTDYKRTQETAAPTAEMLKVEVQSYDPRNLQAFSETLKVLDKPALVVGHSNTTPVLANILSGSDHPMMSEDDYDTLFMVTYEDDGTVKKAMKMTISNVSCD